MREDKLKASCHTRYIVWWPRSASFLPFITTSYRPSDITRVTWLDFVKLGRKEDQTCWLDHQLITIIRFIIIFSNFSVSSACHYFCHYFLRLLVIIKFIFFIIYTFLQKNHHHFHHHWFWRSGKVEKYLSWQLRDVSHPYWACGPPITKIPPTKSVLCLVNIRNILMEENLLWTGIEGWDKKINGSQDLVIPSPKTKYLFQQEYFLNILTKKWRSGLFHVVKPCVLHWLVSIEYLFAR